MKIRDLAVLDHLPDGGVDGVRVSSVTRSKSGGYIVQLVNGICLSARGHDRLEDLSIPKQAHSWDRIQNYGPFGRSY